MKVSGREPSGNTGVNGKSNTEEDLQHRKGRDAPLADFRPKLVAGSVWNRGAVCVRRRRVCVCMHLGCELPFFV